VEFNIAVLVYKALHNLAPPYLSDDYEFVANAGAISFDHQTNSSALSLARA